MTTQEIKVKEERSNHQNTTNGISYDGNFESFLQQPDISVSFVTKYDHQQLHGDEVDRYNQSYASCKQIIPEISKKVNDSPGEANVCHNDNEAVYSVGQLGNSFEFQEERTTSSPNEKVKDYILDGGDIEISNQQKPLDISKRDDSDRKNVIFVVFVFKTSYCV